MFYQILCCYYFTNHIDVMHIHKILIAFEDKLATGIYGVVFIVVKQSIILISITLIRTVHLKLHHTIDSL